MFTVADAQALGWTFVVNGEDGTASKDGIERFQVTSGIPMFSMLNEVAAQEGQPQIDPTPDNVLAATGEVYVEPTVTPDPTPPPSVQDKVAAALEPLQALPTISGTDLAGVILALTT